MPHSIPEIAHSDSGVHTLDSVGTSPHISSAPSYADQQLAEERAEEARQTAADSANKAAESTKEFSQKADSELRRLEKDAGKKYDQFSEEAKQSYEKWKKEAAKDYEKAKKEAKRDGEWMEENRKNPVVVGNAVVIAALGGVLGVGAYRLHRAGELTWKVAGAWAGVVGLFAVADYYVSQYVFQSPVVILVAPGKRLC